MFSGFIAWKGEGTVVIGILNIKILFNVTVNIAKIKIQFNIS